MKRTISAIVKNKILDSVESQPLSSLMLRTLLFFLCIFLSLAVLYPDHILDAAKMVFAWNNNALVKIAFISLMVFNLSRIGKLALVIWKNRTRAEIKPTGETLEGIPVVELLDHLFEHGSFKREDIEGKFGIPRNRYSILAAKLESIGVLIRGDSNARVLNLEYSRADVAAILASAKNARDLKQVFREVAPGSFTREPSGRGVLDRVREALSPLPSPRFELHKLEN